MRSELVNEVDSLDRAVDAMRYMESNPTACMPRRPARDNRTPAESPRIDAALARRVRRLLLAWFPGARREFYWREKAASAFGVLMSEILLCRSRAESVDPVARTLVGRFPTPETLVGASPSTIEQILYPLGLHRTRARLIIRCAKDVVEQHGGRVPDDLRGLMALPYVGRYAASSVACVSFGKRLPVLDANVARVYQRLFSLPPLTVRVTDAKHLWMLADAMLPRKGVREYNWALLDLGGTICKPRTPACGRCPLASTCASFRERDAVARGCR